MTSLVLATALVATIPFQVSQDRPNEAKDPYAQLKAAWPRLQEAWKAASEYKSGPKKPAAEPAAPLVPGAAAPARSSSGSSPDSLSDGALRVVGQTHAAFEAAGLWDEDLLPEFVALKQVFKARLSGFVRVLPLASAPAALGDDDIRRIQEEYERAMMEYQLARGGRKSTGTPGRTTPVDDLEQGAAELLKLKTSRPEEGDLQQDALAKIRKSLRDLAIMDDTTPQWLRLRLTNMVRALILNEPLAELRRPSEQERETVDGLLAKLESDDITVREDALAKLLTTGEHMIPQVLARYRETKDHEVQSRLRQVLGYRPKK